MIEDNILLDEERRKIFFPLLSRVSRRRNFMKRTLITVTIIFISLILAGCVSMKGEEKENIHGTVLGGVDRKLR